MDFKKTLKKELLDFIQLNNECLELSKQLQALRVQKNTKEESIISFLKHNQIESKSFMINDYKVAQKSICQYQQISVKFLESALKDYCDLKGISLDVEDCLGFIKQKRGKKEKEELKLC